MADAKTATKTWWVLIPQHDAGKSASYLRSVDFRLQFGPGTSEYTALTHRRPIQYGPGLKLIYWKGPFATEAEAKKAQAPTAAPNPIAHPYTWLGSEFGGEMASALEGGTVAVLKDLWRAIAPFVILPIGVALMILGFVLFFKSQISELAGVAAQVAAMVAK